VSEPKLGRHEDDRGIIEDLIGPVDSVTRIFTKKGKVRGNHVHYATTQWTYVVYGSLLIVTREPGDGAWTSKTYGPGTMACEKPGTAHAWRALTDVTALVFSRGPRSGEDYESDTFRLTGEDRLIRS